MFDKLIDRSIMTSPRIKFMKNALNSAANDIKKLGMSLLNLSDAVQANQDAILELRILHMQFINGLKNQVADTNLPELPRKDSSDKPN